MKKQLITVTDKAANYIKEKMVLAKDNDKQYLGIRVSIIKGGCSGNEYEFNYLEKEIIGDEKVTDKGITIYIEPKTLLNVIGSQMDYEEDIFNSGLIFKNPNEISRCGCGKSVKF